MLTELRVEGLGVIESLGLVLGPGMTALTGETGAGKTLIVAAIGLLAGERADPSVVRPDTAEAIVEGRFVIDDDELVLTRIVPRDGRSRAYRDGRPISAAALAELAGDLVDLHGQNSHVALLTTASQRRALDRFAGVDLGALQEARAAMRAAQSALDALGGDVATRDRELEFLRFQLDELDAAGLTDPDEDHRLEQEELLLADADAHRTAAGLAADAVAGDEGARDRIDVATAVLADRAPFAALSSRLAAVAAELDEIARELRAHTDAIESDPERLAAVQARRAQLTELRRRFTGAARSGLDDLFRVCDELQARADDLLAHDERARAADEALAAAGEAVAREAAAVGRLRRERAAPLAEAIEARLAELALAAARVRIDVGAEDPGDDVTFQLATNVGLPLAPLAKAASGGELARTMLALRLVTGATAPTLVFDEVDAGVGGAAARAVGRSLAALAARSQVLVVTHLPQVAAFADAQIGLVKSDDGSTTRLQAAVLEGAGRVEELSRMLSGVPGSDAGQEHAEELLVTASKERAR